MSSTDANDDAKKKADADLAQANARAAEQSVADHDAPWAVAQRQAEAREKTSEADQKAADARRAQLTALVPDFSKVKDSTVDLKGVTAPLWSSSLLFKSLQRAAQAVATDVELTSTSRVLVTGRSDLASADQSYMDVRTGLEELIDYANSLLSIEEAPARKVQRFFGVDDAIGLAAAAIPAVMSLLATQTTVSTTSVTASDLAAATAVVGALLAKGTDTKPFVMHDDFRLIPNGVIYPDLRMLSQKQADLTKLRIGYGNQKSKAQTERTSISTQIADLQKDKEPSAEETKKLEALQDELGNLDASIANIDLDAGIVDNLVTAITAFVTTIRAVPPGATRSMLASAALHEGLRREDGGAPLTHVLLVTAQPGEAQQVVRQRFFRSSFTTVVDASITYLLLKLDDASVFKGEIVAAGTETGIYSARGVVGKDPTIAPVIPATA